VQVTEELSRDILKNGAKAIKTQTEETTRKGMDAPSFAQLPKWSKETIVAQAVSNIPADLLRRVQESVSKFNEALRTSYLAPNAGVIVRGAIVFKDGMLSIDMDKVQKDAEKANTTKVDAKTIATARRFIAIVEELRQMDDEGYPVFDSSIISTTYGNHSYKGIINAVGGNRYADRPDIDEGEIIKKLVLEKVKTRSELEEGE